MRVLAVALLASALGAPPSSSVGRAVAQSKQQRREERLRLRRLNVSPRSRPDEKPPASDAGAADDDEVVRVETNLTNVLLTAIDKSGRYVTTLRREDVRVLEDGQPQEVSLFERQTNLPLSLAILIDASRSQEFTMPDEQAAARAFIEKVLRPGKDSATVISFNAEPTSEQSLTGDITKLREAIDRVRVELPPDDPECRSHGLTPVERDPRCWTGIWDAVWVTVNEVLSQTPDRTRRAVILLSDGDDTSSVTKRQEAVDFALKHNTVVYSIGIGDTEHYDLNEGALRKVSEPTGGRAFFTRTKAELDAAFAQIEQELRSQYLISYAPANKARDGSYRRLQIEILNPELRKQKLRLLYRQGYYAGSSGGQKPVAGSR